MLSLIIITLSDPPLTDRTGNTCGSLSIAVNEGCVNTALEMAGFMGRYYARIYGIAWDVIDIIFNNRLYILPAFAFVGVGQIKQV